MNDQSNTQGRIDRMIEVIKNEANEEIEKIRSEAKARAQKQKTKQINAKRDQIDLDFEKQCQNFKVEQRLQKSKKINQSRLTVQIKRNDLLDDLKKEVKESLVERMRNRGEYEKVLENLILQGLVRLLERSVKIRVQEKDVKMTQGMLGAIRNKFSNFIKQELGKDITVNLEVDTKRFVSNEELGGCILICGKGRIVFKNTMSMRLDLVFIDSIPVIRKNLFPSLT
jgi:V-type H+-transporting ATPase subunit E